jgi:8-oxo-dGTP pyrophosphatase MutT (NUDIX family)
LKKKEGYDGQEHTYFLAETTSAAPHKLPEVAAVESPEFRSARWVMPSDFQLHWLPEIKRDVYRRVLADFF